MTEDDILDAITGDKNRGKSYPKLYIEKAIRKDEREGALGSERNRIRYIQFSDSMFKPPKELRKGGE